MTISNQQQALQQPWSYLFIYLLLFPLNQQNKKLSGISKVTHTHHCQMENVHFIVISYNQDPVAKGYSV